MLNARVGGHRRGFLRSPLQCRQCRAQERDLIPGQHASGLLVGPCAQLGETLFYHPLSDSTYLSHTMYFRSAIRDCDVTAPSPSPCLALSADSRHLRPQWHSEIRDHLERRASPGANARVLRLHSGLTLALSSSPTRALARALAGVHHGVRVWVYLLKPGVLFFLLTFFTYSTVQ